MHAAFFAEWAGDAVLAAACRLTIPNDPRVSLKCAANHETEPNTHALIAKLMFYLLHFFFHKSRRHFMKNKHGGSCQTDRQEAGGFISLQ